MILEAVGHTESEYIMHASSMRDNTYILSGIKQGMDARSPSLTYVVRVRDFIRKYNTDLPAL